MFINSRILKKLMKQAYKKGLAIAQSEGVIYLAGDSWEMEVKKEFLPRQILAQIIELAGELPAEETKFRATKEGNQMELPERMRVLGETFIRGIQVTNFSLTWLGNCARILQDEEDGKIFLVDDAFVQIADNMEIDADSGEQGVDPNMVYCDGYGILWENNVAKFHALGMRTDDFREVLNRLESIDLTGQNYEKA